MSTKKKIIYPELHAGRDGKFVPSKVAKASINNPVELIVHHTGGTDANPLADSSNFTFDQCDAYHKTRFNMKSSLGFYVGYHYYISKDGTIKQARLDTDEGAHTINWNLKSLGVCMAGNFDATLPTDAQIATLKKFLKEKMAQYSITLSKVTFHRDHATKTCPGTNLDKNWVANLLKPEDTRITDAISLLEQAIKILKS